MNEVQREQVLPWRNFGMLYTWNAPWGGWILNGMTLWNLNKGTLRYQFNIMTSNLLMSSNINIVLGGGGGGTGLH